MNTQKHTKQYSFKADGDTVEQARDILRAKNLTMTRAINLFFDYVVEKEELPFKTPEEEKADQFLESLIADIDEGYQDVLAGRVKSSEEVFAKYDL
ncbi:type II toxin-antitoxin system RelB/DinJ family antitoxin [Streptococcus didelphis]|uniref:Type II toxin-antitoxin system RelB/DinJ family antitoxin n=1 Tax=Streptococcus didelphis TaxID=102886 RepID=A0ABY9LFM3_9STRE|nr:type II toxin-antitoxin system RelB/DinJ family antitoxin [Streptococcus didelphis]WMB27713.1 type II toxin-antitoxin system RelB/DinJ family antitoxin [Streptococcus didelphis]WMB29823.1 type II toxin-antitoxin system RelB/DinJ family antitoxin [Streptococcus didelphis]